MKVKVKMVNKYGQRQSMVIETLQNGTHELERITKYVKNSFNPKQLKITLI